MSATIGHPVRAPHHVLVRLTEAFKTPADLEAMAASLNVEPPDNRDGWELVYRYGPAGEDMGLFWVHPDDEPIQHLD